MTDFDLPRCARVWYLVYWQRHSVYVDEYDSPEAAAGAAETGSADESLSPVAIFSPNGERTSLWEPAFFTTADMDFSTARALAELDEDEPLMRLLRHKRLPYN